MNEESEQCDWLKSLLKRVLDSFVNGRRVREGIDISLRRECEWEEESEMSEKKEQPKAKSESSDIQGKEASVKITGPKTAESKQKKAPAKEQ